LTLTLWRFDDRVSVDQALLDRCVLVDLLDDFLELNAIPKGPLLLRHLGFDENKFLTGGHYHKLVTPNRPTTTSGNCGFGSVGQRCSHFLLRCNNLPDAQEKPLKKTRAKMAT
jgi:hypothetical protein